MPFMPSAALASGVQRQSETQTVTTDPDTYTVTAEFDCVLPAVVALTQMSTVFVPDGETFGDQPGDLQVAPNTGEQSEDGIVWTPCTAQFGTDQSHLNSIGGFSAPGEYLILMYGTSRYLRITMDVVDHDFAPYAGPNHPTVTFAVSALWV